MRLINTKINYDIINYDWDLKWFSLNLMNAMRIDIILFHISR